MERFGKYELLRRLGVGGMAEVWEASQDGKSVVVKLMKPELAADPAFKQMFVDEARIAARLVHPNIVRLIDFGLAKSRHYLVLEMVRGRDLDGIVLRSRQTKRPIPPAVAVYVIAQAARGLDHAHAVTGPDGKPMGLVHRDVSPANVLVASDGNVKIADFGIAVFDQRMSHTIQGETRGKPRYMSPEHAQGLALDARSDIFSLGTVLYELLAGRAPFEGNTDVEILQDVLRCKPKPIAEIPGPLDMTVRTALAADPGSRYQHASELADALEDWAETAKLADGKEITASLLNELFPDLTRRSDSMAMTMDARQRKHKAEPAAKLGPGVEVEVEAESLRRKPGDVVGGRYELEEVLGHGRGGAVFRARDKELRDIVALKILALAPGTEKDALERSKREILLSRKVNHPNVLRIHDMSTVGGETFLSMRLAEGGSLADRISKSRLELKEAARIAAGVCDGLDAAHEEGVLHRDVSPRSVLLDAQGRPLLSDFGLSRLTDSLTLTAGIEAAPRYTSPEMIDGKEPGAASDVYAASAVAFELLAGRPPFVADSVVRLGMMHLATPAPSIRDFETRVPPKVDAILRAALAKDPADRPTAGQVGRTLRDWVDGRIAEPGNLAQFQPEEYVPPAPRETPPAVRTPSSGRIAAPPSVTPRVQIVKMTQEELAAQTEPMDDRTVPLAAAADGSRTNVLLIAGGVAALLIALAILFLSR